MTHTEARELANTFGTRMCDENGETHGEELYCFSLEDIIEIKKALAQPEQEPVIDKSAAIRIATSLGWTPQRKPLTDEEFDKLLGPFPRYAEEWSMTDFIRFARAIEAAHGIKETK